MPRIEGAPGQPLRQVWVYLSKDEARDLLAALAFWDEQDQHDPQWHHHIGALPGGELTIAIDG